MSVRDPVDLGYTRSKIGLWRGKLFAELGPHCIVCLEKGRKRGAIHLHEGILWRSEVMGFSFPTRLRVFADCNSFPVCGLCHKYAPPREWFFEWSCRRYGEQEVREWYASFNWKVPPDRRFMPDAD
jgi:hypothetical protein